MPHNKHILYGVLNWGLGHATRSIPVIEQLLSKGFKVTLASDGLALNYLKERFPEAGILPLLPLNITYEENRSLVFGLAKKGLHYKKWYHAEKDLVSHFFLQNRIDGIISDNRPTVFSPEIPSAYITHQWRIKAGIFSALATRLHQNMAKHFTQIWIPDVEAEPNLSGKLGHGVNNSQVKYVGYLSELNPLNGHPVYDVALILSGPEPQRTLLENKLIDSLKTSVLKVVLLRGTDLAMPTNIPNHWKVISLACRKEVAEIYAQSRLVVSRSGYSTLMDLYKMPKPALLIPTPGQPEQTYLASLAIHLNNFAIQSQENVDVQKGFKEALEKFKTFTAVQNTPNWDDLFTLF